MMRNSKHKGLLTGILGLLLVGGIAAYAWYTKNSNNSSVETQRAALESFIDATNQASGISGAAFDYYFKTYGNASNFGIMRCVNEVRCDVVVGAQAAKFEQQNQPSPDVAEVSAKTNQVIFFHRATPGFLGGEYPEKEIEARVREFLGRVYPEFAAIEPTLTLDAGMKGTRLNNGNYFYRWENKNFAVPQGLTVDTAPSIQVGITASGFIFSYTNTIELYHDALSQL